MLYRFDVNLTEQDYYEFNRFHLFTSHYGKKQFEKIRILTSVIPLILFILRFASYVLSGFAAENLAVCIVYILLSVFLFFISKPLVWFISKLQIKQMKKQGKLPFTPASTLEFYDDSFVEITPDNKTESKYSLVDSIYIVNGKMIYIFTNSVLAYMLPVKVFESEEQYNSFMDFITEKTKPAIIVDR